MHVTRKLAALRERLDLSQEQLAIEIGLAGRSSIQRYEAERDYSGEYFKIDFVNRLAILVGRGKPPITKEEILQLIDPDLGVTDLKIPPSVIAKIGNTRPEIDNPMLYELQHDLPILGKQKMGEIGVYAIKKRTERPELTARIPQLKNSKQAFGVKISGENMSPEFEDGDIAYVDPEAQLSVRKSVFFIDNEENGYVMRLAKKTIENWSFYEHDNPDKIITHSLDKIKFVYPIVGKWSA